MIKSNRLRNINNIYSQKPQPFDNYHLQTLERRKVITIESYARKNQLNTVINTNINKDNQSRGTMAIHILATAPTTDRFSTNSRAMSQHSSKESREKEQAYKILTIKEINSYNKSIQQFDISGQVVQQKYNSKPKSNRKMFVSISKRNQHSQPKQNQPSKVDCEPRLTSISKEKQLLTYMNSNRKIIQKVEYQVQNIRSNRFFCQ